MRPTGVAAAMCECQLHWLHKLREKDSANLIVVSSAQRRRDWCLCPMGSMSVIAICNISLGSVLNLCGLKPVNSFYLGGQMSVCAKFNYMILANSQVLEVSDTGIE